MEKEGSRDHSRSEIFVHFRENYESKPFRRKYNKKVFWVIDHMFGDFQKGHFEHLKNWWCHGPPVPPGCGGPGNGNSWVNIKKLGLGGG